MSKRTRKRKLEGDNDAEIKEYTDIMSDEYRDEMATMWEIPQIFHFLHMSKEVLHIPHLSMYEMERMLAIPRASKQLANIMTCLLSPPLSKAKMRKVPPMPYDFWINVLTHKVKGWFKVYQSKHQDIVKVLETIGVEPDFWRIFPDASVIDEKDFDHMNFKERVWILKTLCDTIMHSRKTVHDEVMKQCTEEQCEVILGSDRYGAKYFWFPLFLNNDLRVYRHCVDNTILSSVKPPVSKTGPTSLSKTGPTSLPKTDKNGRNKRKRSRWKNGALPRERRRSKKQQDDEVKESGDSALGSLVNEDTNLSGISGFSNNNNIAIESMDMTRSRSLSKTSSEETGVSNATHCSNPKSSGYDTNTSSDAKSVNEAETEEMFRGFGSEIDNENSLDVICSVKDLLDGLTTRVGELIDGEDSSRVREPAITCAISEQDDDDSRSRTIGERNFDSDHEISRTDSGSDDIGWTNKYSPGKSRTPDDEESTRDVSIFAGMLGELGVSSFELVADSLDSLRDLANSLLSNEGHEGRTRSSSVPRCEIILARTMEELVDSLKDVEPTLKESVRKARTKLQREWTNFNDGVVEDEDTSGNDDHGSNRWILGSQGCPLPPTGEATLQTLSESALSASFAECADKRPSSVESNITDADDRPVVSEKSSENKMSKKSITFDDGSVKIKIEKTGSDDNSDVENSKEEAAQENRRVLRRRGISSYTEQFSSDDEEAYELEEWPRLEAVNPTPGTSDGPPAVHTPQKTGQNGDGTDEEDSDQDWILPSSRKRKNKRSPANRKLKTLQQKLQSATADTHDSSSALSPPAATGPPITDPPDQTKTTKDTERVEAPLICKTESVHSELDIKDEGPIFDYSRSVAQPANVNQNYVLQSQSQPAPPTVAYTVVRPAAPPPPFVGILTPVQPGYYLQGHQNYYSPATDPRYMQYTYPSVARGTPRYPYPPGPPPYQPTQNYMQYQTYPQMPPRPPYPMNGVPPSHPAHPLQRNSMNSQRHQVQSTTLYGARSPTKPPPNRMPVPRPVTVQNASYNSYRGTVRPRGPVHHQQGLRWYPPRANAPQPPQPQPGVRIPRPTASKQPKAKVTQPAQKTTSLILLSDSDDEIEMIVPDKQSAASSAQSRKVVPGSKNSRQVHSVGAARAKPKPIVTSEIMVPKSREVLSPQMIQRMSQGGISITPVKPQQSKQINAETSPGTKLVVVVNETGSHYALALPNGSKLILTPEQVAQIRASNGGKLVL